MSADKLEGREWQRFAREIKDVLGLDGWPIAVTYSLDAPANATRGAHRVCHAFLAARDGAVVDLTRESSSCGGGRFQLGLEQRPEGEAARPLKEFLVNGEKLYCSLAAYQRSLTLALPPPLGLAEHVVLAPLHAAEFAPDLVVFIVNAEQACRLITLDVYGTGVPPRVEMSGATCRQVVSYPLVSGETNVSLMDYTSRRIKGYKPSDLFVTFPYHRFFAVMRNVPNCTAGTAKMEVPASFRREVSPETLRELGG